MFKGKNFYGDFLASEEKIATNILADRLLLLEQNGVLIKLQDPSHKQKMSYHLTEKGIDLLPIMVEYIMWSAKYDALSAVEKSFVKNVKKDKETVIKEISTALKKKLKKVNSIQ